MIGRRPGFTRRAHRVACGFLVALGAVAVLADFLASDRPIAMWKAGSVFVLWPPIRHGPTTIPDPGSLESTPPLPPSPDHPLGTDNAGRDALARLVHGARVSLGVALGAAFLQVFIGLTLGLAAGFFGGLVDAAITRATEVVLSFPLLLLLVATQGVLERTSLASTVLVIALTRWAEPCRLVRAEALRVRELPYVEASKALGASPLRILVRHMLPNCVAPAMVCMALGAANAVLLESALSFLGFGAPEPTPSWGLLMADGFQDVLNPQGRLLILAPGLAIFLCISAFNLVAEGLRDALDPRGQGAVDPSAFITSDQNLALSPAPIPDGGEPLPATYSVPEVK